jgi:rare lipoprotein A
MHARHLVVLVTSLAFALGTCTYPQALAAPTHAARAKTHRIAKAIQHGKISWYGREFAGRRTASGERFDPRALTMAHRSLPLGTIVLVINDDNGRSVTLRVNDRGPYCDGRVADVSRAASLELGFHQYGIVDATLEVLWTPPASDDARASS